MVTRIQTAFPDCEALRRVGEERWQRVRIEFEYESRNFLKHFHNADGCDLIICWSHNWPECPLEVVELEDNGEACSWVAPTGLDEETYLGGAGLPGLPV